MKREPVSNPVELVRDRPLLAHHTVRYVLDVPLYATGVKPMRVI